MDVFPAPRPPPLMSLCTGRSITRALAAGWVWTCLICAGRIDAAQAPTAILLSESTVVENRTSETLVAYMQAVDPDSPTNHVFELVDGPGIDDNEFFYIEGNELRLRLAIDLDFEQYPDAYWTVRIRVTDTTGMRLRRVIVLPLADDREEDFDNDGLSEAEEEDIHGSSDLLYDTDQDGVGDAAEIAIGTSPTDPDEWSQAAVLGWGRAKDGELAVPYTGSLDLLVTGQYNSLALSQNGVVKGWGGGNEYGQLTPPNGVGEVIALAAGGEHWIEGSAFSMALKQDGAVIEWGYDNDGTIVVPEGLDDVVAIAAGRCARMALRENGTVVTWGEDPFGNIQPPAGLTDVVAISAGGYRCLALKGDGTVVEWGMNFDQEKWHETSAPAGLREIVAISAGRFHSLALRSDGTVAAWGCGVVGQTQVPAGLGGVVAIKAGGFHSLALKEDGTLVAWGLNSSGQCNVPITAQQQVREISAGVEHSLATKQEAGKPKITSSPRIEGTPGALLTHPVLVDIDPDATPLVFSALGLPDGLSINPSSGVISGSVLAAVRRAVQIRVLTPYGLLTQAALLSITDGSPPQSVALILEPEESSENSPQGLVENSLLGTLVGTFETIDPDAGDVHSYEWVDGTGADDNGLFRIDGKKLFLLQDLEKDFEQDPTGFSIRIRVIDPSFNTHEEIITIGFEDDPGEDADGDGLTQAEEESAMTSDLTIDTDEDGFSDRFEIESGQSPIDEASMPAGRLLMEWGGEPLHAGATPLVGTGVIDVAAGGAHSLMLGSNGSVVCRGSNASGQCTPPPGLQDVIAVSAGRFHSMALKRDKTVVAWGDNSANQCDVPANLSGVVAIAAGGYHSLALMENGQVVAWGYDANGQSAVPGSLGNVVEIAAGGFHSLALREDGTVVAWGSDWRGVNEVPGGLEGVTGIAAGGYHCLALRHDGTVVAWGDWQWGQTDVPSGLNDVIEIAAGWNHNLLLHSDGSLTTWGASVGGLLKIPPEAGNVRRISAGESHNLAIRQDVGFPDFADVSPILGWPGRMLDRTIAISNTNPQTSVFSSMGMPDGLTLGLTTGQVSGMVTVKQRRAVRIMVDTDQGVLARVFWLDTGAGLPPVQIKLSSKSVMENAPAGTLVGVIDVIDPDDGDSHVFQLEFSDDAPDSYRFFVDGKNLRTQQPMDVDYENTEPFLYIRIKATDSGGNVFSSDVDIDLMDDRLEDSDGDGASEAMEEDVLGTSDLTVDDFAIADPDKDGIPSLIEHAFNMDPVVPGPMLYIVPGAGSTMGLPGIHLVQAGPADFRLRMEYVCRIGDGLKYTPQFAGGMAPGEWEDASDRVIVTPIITPINNLWERRIVEDTMSTANSGRRFGRVVVEMANATVLLDHDSDGINQLMEESVFYSSDEVYDDFKTADSDVDGIPGIIEYAFNLDPVNPNPPLVLGADSEVMAGLPCVKLALDGNGVPKLCIEFLRRMSGPVTYRAQFTSDLAAGDWTAAEDALTESETVAPGWQRCMAWDSMPYSSHRRRFGRVAVSW